MSSVSALILDEERSLTSALMVMLGSDGLAIPALGAVDGNERHGPVLLGPPELFLLNELRRGGRPLCDVVQDVADQAGAKPEHLREVLQKLWDRGLLINVGLERTDPGSAQMVPEQGLSVCLNIPAPQIIATPRFFRLSRGWFEHIDHEGRLRAQFSAIELAALSEFRQPLTVLQAFDAHRLSCGPLALDESGFSDLLRRLDAADLLERKKSQDDVDLTRSVWNPLIRRGRSIGRDRFQTLNLSIRQAVENFEITEREHVQRVGRRRVKVVSVQQNGTIFPLALGMIVAAAKFYDGGRLNEHYAFHPDWLVRPSKVRALTQEPGIFLFSNYSWSHRHNVMVSRKVKDLSPWSVTIHGGPNTPKYDADCEAYFRENPDVDITVRGEGEIVVAELLEALVDVVGNGPPDLSTLRDVAGISFRNADRIVRTADRKRIVDLDSIPSPILTGLFDAYKGATEFGIIESNRGCPYSCTFCDWGSAIASKVRKFSLERVFAELEWCAANEVDGIMCADANFGIFERDVQIAEKVAELKERYGYPSSFSTNFAKNTTTHLKRIIEILTNAGVISTSTIAVQSMDSMTLKAIKRSNIKIKEYDALATEFRKADLPLFMDLMFGLPGQTFTSFQNDLQECINRGVYPRMYMTELLVNSPMNEPSYREQHCIKTELSADGSRKLVVSTTSFSRQEYDEMNRLRQLFSLCHIFGMLREVAHYVRSETGVREIDFYERLRCDIRGNQERWPTLAFSVRALPSLLVPPVSWQLVIEETRRYLTEVWNLKEDGAMTTVLAVQHAVLPARDRVMPQTLELPHDYASWHQAMVNATQAGHHDHWPSLVPRLREFKPASFDIGDHDRIGPFGIGPALYGVQPETSVTIRADT